jgi:hypothetical protein
VPAVAQALTLLVLLAACAESPVMTLSPRSVSQGRQLAQPFHLSGIPAHLYLTAAGDELRSVRDLSVTVGTEPALVTQVSGLHIVFLLTKPVGPGRHDVVLRAKGVTYRRGGEEALLVKPDGSPDAGGARCDSCEAPGHQCLPDYGCVLPRWVDASCAGDGSCGDGQLDAPLKSIAEAISSFPANASSRAVHVAPGRYEESRRLLISGNGLLVVLAAQARATSGDNDNNRDDDDENDPVQETKVRWTAPGETVLDVVGNVDVHLRGLRLEDSARGLSCRAASRCSLVEVTFAGHGEHALVVGNGAEVTLDRCLLQDNAGGAVSVVGDGRLNVVNSFVIGNGSDEAKAGGFWGEDRALIELVNSTVADNRASEAGRGAVFLEGSAELTLYNSILWNNGRPAAEGHCPRCMDGGGSLLGHVAPRFQRSLARSAPSHYRLGAASPARDNGVNAATMPAVDFWSSPRDDGAIDSGAHEYQRDER